MLRAILNTVLESQTSVVGGHWFGLFDFLHNKRALSPLVDTQATGTRAGDSVVRHVNANLAILERANLDRVIEQARC